jgi:predicted RNase H-like HicB family nuclease
MEFTIVIAKISDRQWRAVVPALPDCEAEAETRDEVLAKIKNRISQMHIEVLRVEVPDQPVESKEAEMRSNGFKFEEEWPDFGKFKGNPVWSAVFDEIEQERDRIRVGE